MSDTIKQHAAARAVIEAQFALWAAIGEFASTLPSGVNQADLAVTVSYFCSERENAASVSGDDIAAFICDLEEGN